MPIYEFRCVQCGHLFEELCRLNESGEGLTCPDCGQMGARRQISVFAAHGLENGHIAVGRKLTGQSGQPADSNGSSSAAASPSSTSADAGSSDAKSSPAAAPSTTPSSTGSSS